MRLSFLLIYVVVLCFGAVDNLCYFDLSDDTFYHDGIRGRRLPEFYGK